MSQCRVCDYIAFCFKGLVNQTHLIFVAMSAAGGKGFDCFGLAQQWEQDSELRQHIRTEKSLLKNQDGGILRRMPFECGAECHGASSSFGSYA